MELENRQDRQDSQELLRTSLGVGALSLGLYLLLAKREPWSNPVFTPISLKVPDEIDEDKEFEVTVEVGEPRFRAAGNYIAVDVSIVKGDKLKHVAKLKKFVDRNGYYKFTFESKIAKKGDTVLIETYAEERNGLRKPVPVTD